MVVRRAEGFGPREILERRGHRPAAAASAERLLRSAAGEWRELGKDIRLLDDHDGAAAGGLRRGKALPQPGDIGGGACSELGTTFRPAAAAASASYDLPRNQRDVPPAPPPLL